MKRIIFFLLFSCAVAAAGFAQESHVQFETLTFSEALDKAKAQKKYIFLDAYTDWCVPCKRMEKEVFSKEQVADYLNASFVNVKFDMEKGEGVLLRERFGVAAFPTYLILEPNGALLHKMIGYAPAETFLDKVRKGISPDYSSENLKKRFLAGERDPSFIRQYKKVLTETYDRAGLLWLCGQLFPRLTDAQRFDSSSWAIYKSSIRSYKDTIFQYMLYHQDRVSEFVPKEELVDKLKTVCFVTLFDHYTGKKPLPEMELAKVMNDIRFIPVGFQDDVHVVARAILLQNEGKYDQLVTLYEQFVSGLKINRTFWDKHLAGLQMKSPAQNQRVKAYLERSKENCHPNSVKFYTGLLAQYLEAHK